MDNKVAYTLARCCTEAGLLAVRFNFRGVGKSEGSFDEGRGESDDALAVLDWLQEKSGLPRFVFAGFSFGAFVALRASLQKAPVQLVTIAPPLGYFGNEPVPRPDCPWLVLHGDADEVVDCADTVARLRPLRPAVELHVLPGVTHFFHGELSKLRELVTPVLRRRLAPPG
jgi:alpha/beta superfamily hydrolase